MLSLIQIYHLLVIAHYQTRPSDLEQILSNPDTLIFIAYIKEKKINEKENENKRTNDIQIIATALIAREGGLTPSQCQRIESATLRLPGHLLPQSIMAHQGEISAGELSYWRIMRIAVSHQYQQHHIGSGLIDFIAAQAFENKIDLLGASFSLTPEVVNFWYRNQFKCSRIALRRDSSTGQFPGEFLRLVKEDKGDSSNPQAVACYHRLLKQFNKSLSFSLSASFSSFDSETLLPIIEWQINTESINTANSVPSEHQHHEILRYTEKARSYEMVEWLIHQFVKNSLSKKGDACHLATNDKCLLVEKTLQNHDWNQIIYNHRLTGKKAAQEKIRAVIEALLGQQ